MPKYNDSLRGYGFSIHQRDHFRCRYCGLDGTTSFANWTSLSCDHLLPLGDTRRNNSDFIVTACMFCNTADNQYFRQAHVRNLTFENKSPDDLVEQRRLHVNRTRNSYKTFWEEHVKTPESSFEAKPQESLETVFKVGAEGGSLSILRQRNESGAWEYRSLRDESTMLDILEKDELGDGVVLFEKSEPMATFEDALLRLDKYRWFRLYPLKVSAEFADLVVREVAKRGGKEAAIKWIGNLNNYRLDD